MLKIYLDNCCYGRPFDPPSNPTIVFESAAKILIQTLITNKKITLVNSFVIYEEVSAVPNQETRKLIIDFLDNAEIYVAKDKLEQVLVLAIDIMKTGVKYMDAAHVACAVIANSDYLITTDKRLLKYKSDKINIINPVDFIRMWEDSDND
ncbi:MAG: type II toxin-antitoxin system VapC family toxin [Oscillospiraceae bacterium]|nr:type II toxin-antitoxin system VapC family toxin [Oscillospiraceae bacterium]